ncbi:MULTISPECIES: hypothetical protein [Pseudomonas syringae group]|uniref:Uncharacterized protein n=1 Tax=Pseudomonas coronafaciens pv. coronafaciens TaxID=235275 RepID=A0AAE6UKV4_9PSED|nr:MULTISPECIES: hypothetical protein [Pseudomonas syringae group]KPX33819.1 hypothetical protein ALO77_101308 [Pseudomonas coronafaciens pv. garcae]MCF5713081.1 hypothetical protein [Pseudomonas tremae]MCF5745880.1 hypothetical protein [Pseudomonas tremae]MCQ3025796.1 hypothetical protein [Pseudomonas tremae]QGT80890.1 hypothetical protein GMO17_06700 [Pseudomonas coronafaciens pv. coronafaciens]
MKFDYELIENNLDFLLVEIKSQSEVASYFPVESLSYDDQVNQLDEWLHDAGEYGLVYESIVCLLEKFPFKLSGIASIKLLEVGLIFGFKTEMEIDSAFDRR